MKNFPIFLNIFIIVVLSLSLLTPELVSGVTPPARMPAMNTKAAPPPLLNIAAIAAGADHTCALTTSGGVKCWGQNLSGQLGDGTTIERHTPVDVSGLVYGVIAIAPGHGHTCALTAGGGVKCWGRNYYGELGDGTTIQRLTPVDVSGLASGVSAITAGGYHSCALTVGGGVKCWGYNNHGQLGDGTRIDHLTPVNVIGLSSGVSAIATGSFHNCALTSGGGVKCWGDNWSGQLGDGTTNDHYTPVNVSGMTSGVSAIDAGVDHTCALTTEGGVKCWGQNLHGQLGDGTTTDRHTPVDVSGLASGVSAIATRGFHTCALTADGGVKCWGQNYDGQLGDGTTIGRHTPVNVSGLTSGVSAIDTGGAHTCALTLGSRVMCWGSNWYGQLGDGTTTRRLTPVNVVEPMWSTHSAGSKDGWVLESSEASNVGGTINSAATVFYLGDDPGDRQYRAILSFGTSGLPNNAVITSAILKIKKQGLTGTDPFTTHQGLKVDIRKPYFGTSIWLEAGDFQAPGSLVTGTFNNVPSSGWYNATLSNTFYPYINLSGSTQFRLRFKLGDNDDMGADYLKFYSGNFGGVSFRPMLVIEYFVP